MNVTNKVIKEKHSTSRKVRDGITMGVGCFIFGIIALFALGLVISLAQGEFTAAITCAVLLGISVLVIKKLPKAVEDTTSDFRFNNNQMLNDIISKIPQPFDGEIWTASDGIRVNEAIYRFKDYGYGTISQSSYHNLAEWFKRHVKWTDPEHVVVEAVSKDQFTGSRSYGSAPRTYYETPDGSFGASLEGAGTYAKSTIYRVHIRNYEPKKNVEKLKNW